MYADGESADNDDIYLRTVTRQQQTSHNQTLAINKLPRQHGLPGRRRTPSKGTLGRSSTSSRSAAHRAADKRRSTDPRPVVRCQATARRAQLSGSPELVRKLVQVGWLR